MLVEFKIEVRELLYDVFSRLGTWVYQVVEYLVKSIFEIVASAGLNPRQDVTVVDLKRKRVFIVLPSPMFGDSNRTSNRSRRRLRHVVLVSIGLVEKVGHGRLTLRLVAIRNGVA